MRLEYHRLLLAVPLALALLAGCGFDSTNGPGGGGGDGTASSFCHPFAQNIVDLADSQGCAGAGESAATLESKCDQFVSAYVDPSGCDAEYASYLSCAAAATTCNPCRPEYCAFNSCMCAANGSNPNLCLPSCQ